MDEGQELKGSGVVPTVTDDDRTAHHAGETRARIVGVVVMLLIVVAALAGILGPRDATGTAQDQRGALEVTHSHLTRPGLDTAIVVRIDPVTTDGPITVLVDAAALSTLGIITVQPAPSAEKTRDGMVEYEFTPAGEPPYEVRIAGRLPTKAQPARFDWQVAWAPTDGEPITVDARTWVLP